MEESIVKQFSLLTTATKQQQQQIKDVVLNIDGRKNSIQQDDQYGPVPSVKPLITNTENLQNNLYRLNHILHDSDQRRFFRKYMNEKLKSPEAMSFIDAVDDFYQTFIVLSKKAIKILGFTKNNKNSGTDSATYHTVNSSPSCANALSRKNYKERMDQIIALYLTPNSKSDMEINVGSEELHSFHANMSTNIINENPSAFQEIYDNQKIMLANSSLLSYEAEMREKTSHLQSLLKQEDRMARKSRSLDFVPGAKKDMKSDSPNLPRSEPLNIKSLPSPHNNNKNSDLPRVFRTVSEQFGKNKH